MNELIVQAETERMEEVEIPNPKSQIPNKFQTTNSNDPLRLKHRRNLWRDGLEFGIWSLFGIWILVFGISAHAAAPLYQNNFTTNEVGKLPEEMLLLDGGFAVQEVAGNNVLQLPGAPLETFGVLFGPTEASGLVASVRIHSAKKGRREPAFALGLNGNAGYKLQISAAKKLVELYKGDDVIASEPFTWESDSWTMLKLQVRKVKDGEFAIEGKA